MRTVFRKCAALCLALLLAAALIPGQGRAEAGEPPRSVILLEGGEELEWVCGVPFTDPGYTAWGADGEEMTQKVRVSGQVKTWLPGEYTLRYRFQERNGAQVTAERLVRVVPAPPLPETVPAEKTLYLTFDDGPSEYTADVLEILAKYEIKATFFVVTSSSHFAEMAPKIVEAGHTLGLHAHKHMVAWLYEYTDNYFNDLMQGQRDIYELTGEYTHFVRLPGGSRSAKLMFDRLKGGREEFDGIMQGMGLRYFDWNIQPESVPQDTVGTVDSFTHPKEPYDSGIVLMHDTRQYSILALEDMIQWALEQGYRFDRIDLSTPEVHTHLP